MIANEDVELVQRVINGQARMDLMNKLASVIKDKETKGGKK